MSASLCSCRVETVPLSSMLMPLTSRSCSTLRKVTGKMAGPLSPSAKRSTTPKGDAANLASGGIKPVATLSGNKLALVSLRSLVSLKPAGKTIRIASFSPNGGAKRTRLTSPSFSSSENVGLTLPLAFSSRISSASLRLMDALNIRVRGRIGKQPACALLRSQVNSAVNGWRTR